MPPGWMTRSSAEVMGDGIKFSKRSLIRHSAALQLKHVGKLTPRRARTRARTSRAHAGRRGVRRTSAVAAQRTSWRAGPLGRRRLASEHPKATDVAEQFRAGRIGAAAEPTATARAVSNNYSLTIVSDLFAYTLTTAIPRSRQSTHRFVIDLTYFDSATRLLQLFRRCSTKHAHTVAFVDRHQHACVLATFIRVSIVRSESQMKTHVSTTARGGTNARGCVLFFVSGRYVWAWQ
jgi:hypothetical protein